MDKKNNPQHTQDAPGNQYFSRRALKRFVQKEPKRFALLVMAFMAVAGLAIVLISPLLSAEDVAAQAQPPARPLTTVETVEVSVGPAFKKINAVGTLLSNESVVVCSEIPGRIASIDFTEGDRVAGHKTLIRLDASVLQAELDKARANLALHRADYQRAESLLKNRAISQRERDQAYALWLLDKANVRLAEAQLAKTVIRAPFGGALGLRRVSLGDYVNPGQPLVNIEDDLKLKVEFQIPETLAPQVQESQTFQLVAAAMPDRLFSGRVYAVNPLVNSASRSLVLRGIIDNSEKALRPGQFVKVSLTVGRRDNAIFVPEQAIIPQPKRQFVFKVVEGKVAMAEVSLGKREKGWVEIIAGLNPRDVVITGGIQKIGPGMPVNAVAADPGLFADRTGKGLDGNEG